MRTADTIIAYDIICVCWYNQSSWYHGQCDHVFKLTENE